MEKHTHLVEALEVDAPTFYTALVSGSVQEPPRILQWAQHSAARTQTLLEAVAIEEQLQSTLSRIEKPKQMPRPKRRAGSALRLTRGKRGKAVAPAFDADSTVEKLRMALEKAVLHMAQPTGSFWTELYVRRVSEYEDFARFVVSRSQHIAFVSGPSGCGKSMYALEKLAHPDGLRSYMDAQGLRARSCSGLMLRAPALQRLSVSEGDTLRQGFPGAVASFIKARLITHFSRREDANWVPRIDNELRHASARDAKRIDASEPKEVASKSGLYIAAAILLSVAHDELSPSSKRLLKLATTAEPRELPSRLASIAEELSTLGAVDLDSALPHIGVERPDAVFWSAMYATWFEQEQPCLIIDELDAIDQRYILPFVLAVLRFSEQLVNGPSWQFQKWKLVLTFRSETASLLRSIAWPHPPAWIVLGERAGHAPADASPLCNPLTPDRMHKIVDQRLRSVARAADGCRSADEELLRAADRLTQIFQAQWQAYVDGEESNRVSSAAECANANIRAALMNIFITCLEALYRERHALRRESEEHPATGSTRVFFEKRAAVVAQAFKEHWDALVKSIRDPRKYDVIQEVFARTLTVNDVNAIDAWKNYLSIIARRVMYETRKEDAREREVLTIDSTVVEEICQKGADAFNERHEDRLHAEQLLQKLLSTLSKPHREMILLQKCHGYSYAEVASELKYSPDTVKKYLRLAMSEMRETLRKMDEFGASASRGE